MGKDVFSPDEMMAKTGVSAADLDAWVKAKLLKPLGFAEEGAPFYGAADADRALHLKKLREIGYGLEEIQKIVKKFGFPKTGEGAAKDTVREKLLTVGQLAEKTGLSPRTIKHWEDMGIIDPDMRSGGGFRLYADAYVFLCELIRDLQLFGYSLEEIKTFSDRVRDFRDLSADLNAVSKTEASRKIEGLLAAAAGVTQKTTELKRGIERWEDLLKKKKKEIAVLKSRNEKRPAAETEKAHA